MGKVDLHAHEFVNEEPKASWYLLKRQNPDQHVSGDLFLKVVLVYHPKWETSLRGGYRLFKRQYAPAIEDLTDAIREFKDSPEQLFPLLEFRCTAFMGSKNFVAAKEDVLAMVSIKKNHPSCYYFLGRVNLALEDYDEAHRNFTDGLEANPGNARLAHALMSLRKNAQSQTIRKTLDDATKALKANQAEHASELITEALVKSDPNNYLYYWYRAITRLAAGRPELAEKDIRLCCDKNPNWPRQLPTKQGKMSKRGQFNPAAQERYFYLQDRFLFYYKTNKAKDFKGFIIMQGASLDAQKKDIFIRTQHGARIFSLSAPSLADASEWVEVLKKASKLPLTLPVEEVLSSMPIPSKDSSLAVASSSNPVSISPASSMMISSSPLTPVSSFGASSLTTASTVAHSQVVVSGISHEGWLYKAGEINTRFKKRWFVLRSEILYYFKGRPEAKDDVYSGVQGSIPITKYMIQRVPSPDFAFELLPHVPGGRAYLLHASSDEERTRWIDEITMEVRRAAATLSCKESERASLELSTDDECMVMADSLSPPQPVTRSTRETPEVRLFTPKPAEINPDIGLDAASMDLSAGSGSSSGRRSRPQSRYYTQDAVNAGIINARRQNGGGRASYIAESDSEDEYSPLVKDYSYDTYASHGSGSEAGEESKGCCACTIM
jgi:tetratricopeptide (TPR) repeat protein